MAEIKNLIKSKEEELRNIDIKLTEELDLEEKPNLLNKKNKLINEKSELQEILIKFNTIAYNPTNENNIKKSIKPRKRKYEYESDDSKGSNKQSDEEIVGVLKDYKGIRTIIKKKMKIPKL